MSVSDPEAKAPDGGAAAAIDPEREMRARVRAGWISLLVAAVLLVVKFRAYQLTGSTAVLSDALESIVNVVAAAFALVGLWFAAQPADRNHPYGHGKVEFLAAAFEGGLISFAAMLILWESAHALWLGAEIRKLDVGILLVGGAGIANGMLGFFLVRAGRRLRSLTLIADGQHVLSDFFTSVGLVVGLLLVRATGMAFLDPLIAMLVAFLLLGTGVKLVRTAAGGLLDEEDPELVAELVELLSMQFGQGVIRVHHLRAIRAGSVPHISAHLVVPEFWSVEQAHDLSERVAAAVQAQLPEGAIEFHTDPCHRSYCSMCDVEACSVRRQPFSGRPPLSADEAVRPDLPGMGGVATSG
jgi:cation diffusion facilitator family transporter